MREENHVLKKSQQLKLTHKIELQDVIYTVHIDYHIDYINLLQIHHQKNYLMNFEIHYLTQ